MGGGKSLTLCNILIDFGDEVLWFVKVLIGLYALFYIYCIIRRYNRFLSTVFLIIATAGSSASVAFLMRDFQAISVPFFFLGIILSLDKEKKGVQISIVLLSLIAIIEFATLNSLSLAVHNVIDVVAIAVLIIVCSIKYIEIRIPSFIAALSFDIYLVHNKVLMAMKANTEIVELLPFIALTIITTLGFYLLRTKMLAIK